jgi:16S rRNA (cytidine1402-2'-O)-methyltransferase
VVLHACASPARDALATAEPLLQALLPLMPLKQGVALVAELTGHPKNALYERALAWKATQTDG